MKRETPQRPGIHNTAAGENLPPSKQLSQDSSPPEGVPARSNALPGEGSQGAKDQAKLEDGSSWVTRTIQSAKNEIARRSLAPNVLKRNRDSLDSGGNGAFEGDGRTGVMCKLTR